MSKIIQVIPCVEPVYALYNCRIPGEEAWFYEKCLYLCLNDSGEIHPLVCMDGYFDSVEEDRSFWGVYTKDQLPAELNSLRAGGFRILDDKEAGQ